MSDSKNKPSGFFELTIRLVEDEGGAYDISVYTMVPNALYRSLDPRVGAPEAISAPDSSKSTHVTLPIEIEGEISKLSHYFPGPIQWGIEDVVIPPSSKSLVFHVVLGDKVLTSRVVDVSPEKLETLPYHDIQRLSDLGRIADGVIEGAVDVIKTKLKDVGY